MGCDSKAMDFRGERARPTLWMVGMLRRWKLEVEAQVTQVELMELVELVELVEQQKRHC